MDVKSLVRFNRVESVFMETTDIVINDLETHSPRLEDNSSSYVTASERINAVYFCEEYTTSGTWNQVELNVQYQSAIIPGDRNATSIILHNNHHNLVRFSSKTENDYKTVLYYLKSYADGADAAVREKWIGGINLRSSYIFHVFLLADYPQALQGENLP